MEATIPDYIIKGLGGIVINEEILEKIKKHLNSSEARSINQLFDDVGSVFDSSDVSRKNGGALLATLIHISSQTSKSTEELVKALNSQIPSFDINISNFIETTSSLEFRNKLRVLQKAHKLEYNRSKIATDFSILSDLRPIFSDTEELLIESFVDIHTFKITFKTNETKGNEIFLSIDSSDIKRLKELVDRADQKANLLSSFMKKQKEQDGK